METNLIVAACAFASSPSFSLVVSMANAARIDHGGGLIYDADHIITWLADANYAIPMHACSTHKSLTTNGGW